MKTDALFYDLIKELPQIFFELIGKPDTNPSIYQFIAPEIKQPSFRLDGLFSTKEGFDNEPLYFVEFQTYKDDEFYERLFGEIFVYFRQYRPPNSDWYAIVVYDRRSNETSFPLRYRALLEPHLRRFYLDELGEVANDSLGVGILRLVVKSEKQAREFAKQLINQARVELTDAVIQQKVLEFIETIVIYKFPKLSREEIEVMLNLNLFKQTRVYQEAKEEGKEEGKLETQLKIVPKLVERGMSIQEIADLLELDTETIRKYLRQQ
ncbi:MAG: Rpn family recombination-promoting nuclease/putative transposase [Stigonema ocellatum SAG 48.90 = DSM 106950]|nr:Rpn family recombination-promoting nuclease/putative transposase [Stigonema ocellatum SAG 48.90 = DSM 106950]